MIVISMATALVPVLMTLTFTTFVATGSVLTPRRVFTALSLISTLSCVLVHLMCSPCHRGLVL